MAFDPVSFAMGAKGSGGGGGSGGGATICQCTFDDEEEIITSTMTASELWSACQSGVVVCSYSIETLSGTTVSYLLLVLDAELEVDGDDHYYSFKIGNSDVLYANSDSGYPATEGK